MSAASDTLVTCTAGGNPGGTYPVMVHHKIQGRAQSDLMFTYELTLSGVQPSEGKQRQTFFFILFMCGLHLCNPPQLVRFYQPVFYQSSSSGSFGGGALLSVQGSGFDPRNSTVLICGEECEVDRDMSTSSRLYCESPFNNGTEGDQ